MKRSVNQVRKECFDAYSRGETELAKKLELEYRHMVANPKVKTVPMSPATKARRRAFANLYGRNG